MTLQDAKPGTTYTATKVPEITAVFWVIKTLTTGSGEATSDWFAGINPALAGVIIIAGFGISLWLQFRAVRYIPAVYWFAVANVAVFGTVAADALHVGLDIPYAVSSVFYALALAAVFWLWRRSEGTLSIHSITTRRRETYYWLTVLATFALGTALGDLTAVSLNLGYFASAVLFAVVMLVPVVAYYRFRVNPVATFWAAYVVTRPLGASLADWLGKPPSLSGLGFGDGDTALVGFAAIVVLVAYLARKAAANRA